MSHTPGPWYLHPKQKVNLRGNCFHYRHDITGPEFAEPVCSLYGSGKTEANANLISSAPELLDLCEMMLERLEDEKMAALWESPEEHQAEMDTYRKIIAKARGES